MKIVHTADWHLCDTQMGLSSRGDDFTLAALTVISAAKAAGADIIVNSGDIFDVSRPSAKKLKDIQHVDDVLVQEGIRMLTISGNHDKTDPSWIDVARLKNVINIDDKEINIDGVKFVGLPFLPVGQLKAKLKTLDGGDFLVLHCAVQELIDFESHSTISIEELPYKNFKAILLGDIHRHGYIEHEQCHIGYPGSIELCNRRENSNKFVELFELEEGQINRISLPLKSRAVLELRIMTDEDLDVSIQKAEENKQYDPIVYVHYSYGMPDSVPRIRAVLNQDAIVKAIPIPGTSTSLVLKSDKDKDALLSPKDFVQDYIPGNSDLSELGMKCCSSKENPALHISDYIACKLNKF